LRGLENGLGGKIWQKGSGLKRLGGKNGKKQAEWGNREITVGVKSDKTAETKIRQK